jgi:hypothetical protein
MLLVAGFEPASGHMGFVVDKVALRQVSSEYFRFPLQFSLRWLIHNHHHLSSGAGTIGQLVADVPSGLHLTPPQETKTKTKADYENVSWMELTHCRMRSRFTMRASDN